MKALEEMTVREAAREIYEFARENAEQVVIYHPAYDPREDTYEYTKEWECDGVVLDMAGMQVKVFATFECPTTDEVLEDDYCTYFRTEYVGGTDEQYNLYTAYSDALVYELKQITGDEWDVE